jgi:hypothetical protein
MVDLVQIILIDGILTGMIALYLPIGTVIEKYFVLNKDIIKNIVAVVE